MKRFIIFVCGHEIEMWGEYSIFSEAEKGYRDAVKYREGYGVYLCDILKQNVIGGESNEL